MCVFGKSLKRLAFAMKTSIVVQSAYGFSYGFGSVSPSSLHTQSTENLPIATTFSTRSRPIGNQSYQNSNQSKPKARPNQTKPNPKQTQTNRSKPKVNQNQTKPNPKQTQTNQIQPKAKPNQTKLKPKQTQTNQTQPKANPNQIKPNPKCVFGRTEKNDLEPIPAYMFFEHANVRGRAQRDPTYP
jgi:outer membrane biosynthesis protein TonB